MMVIYKILLNVFLILGIVSVGVYAETNGVWHNAEDVRIGTFADDEHGIGDWTFRHNDVLFRDNNVYYEDVELDEKYVEHNESNTIYTDMIIDGSIYSADVHDGTIATIDIVDGAITSGKILDDTVGTVDMANGAITSEKILDATIEGYDLVNEYEFGSAYDYRFVEVTGDDMSGKLTVHNDVDVDNKVSASQFCNPTGCLSINGFGGVPIASNGSGAGNFNNPATEDLYMNGYNIQDAGSIRADTFFSLGINMLNHLTSSDINTVDLNATNLDAETIRATTVRADTFFSLGINMLNHLTSSDISSVQINTSQLCLHGDTCISSWSDIGGVESGSSSCYVLSDVNYNNLGCNEGDYMDSVYYLSGQWNINCCE